MSTRQEALQMLRQQRDIIEKLKEHSPYSEVFRQWHRDTEALIAQVWGGETQIREAFRDILYTPLFLSCRGGDTVFDEAYQEGLRTAQRLLDSLTCRLGDKTED
jgi:hypothetical protein